MNLYHLRVFLVVAEQEHISHAAEALALSQPAVTKIVQHLEQEVRCSLIERHGRRIVLTHVGHILHEYAKRIFGLEREMEEAIALLREVEAGDITFAANTTTGVYLLPTAIAHFRTRYPQVSLNMTILNSHEIIEQIMSWKLDFGLIEGNIATLPSEIHAQVFAHDDLILVVSPRHAWSQLTAVEPEVLCHQQVLLREKGSGIREVIEQAVLQQGVQLHPLLTLPDNEAIKQMVMSGVGAAILSTLAVQRELATGDLVRIPLVGIALQPALSIIQRKDKQLSRAAQAFCTLLQEQELSGRC